MRLYLAGPMTGKPLWNFPAFDTEALRLRRVGYDVVSPAELDRIHGVHEFSELPPKGTPERIAHTRAVGARDTDAICLHTDGAGCDGIALLPDWNDSVGVQMELAVARFLGLPIHTVDEWIAHARLHREEVESGAD